MVFYFYFQYGGNKRNDMKYNKTYQLTKNKEKQLILKNYI